MNLSLTDLPSLELRGQSTTVYNETDIGSAVTELRQRLPQSAGGFILLYDGTEPDRITVSAATGASSDDGSLGRVAVPAASEGVSVIFDTVPESIADTWVLIDAELEKRGLTSHGVYRQIMTPEGGTTLQAPVRERRCED